MQFFASTSTLAVDANSSATRSRSPAKRDAGDASLSSQSDDGHSNQTAKGKSRDVVEIESSSDGEQDDDIPEAATSKKRGLYMLLFIQYFNLLILLPLSFTVKKRARGLVPSVEPTETDSDGILLDIDVLSIDASGHGLSLQERGRDLDEFWDHVISKAGPDGKMRKYRRCKLCKYVNSVFYPP